MFFNLKERRNYSYLFLVIFGLSFLAGFVLNVEFGLVVFFQYLRQN